VEGGDQGQPARKRGRRCVEQVWTRRGGGGDGCTLFAIVTWRQRERTWSANHCLVWQVTSAMTELGAGRHAQLVAVCILEGVEGVPKRGQTNDVQGETGEQGVQGELQAGTCSCAHTTGEETGGLGGGAKCRMHGHPATHTHTTKQPKHACMYARNIHPHSVRHTCMPVPQRHAPQPPLPSHATCWQSGWPDRQRWRGCSAGTGVCSSPRHRCHPGGSDTSAPWHKFSK
jgi:hypothetical protein